MAYTQEMLDSIKKVEAHRAERVKAQKEDRLLDSERRLTADEKDVLLKENHPDYIKK